MTRPSTPRAPTSLRAAFTAVVAIGEAVLLAYEHMHGGIARHHLLNDPTLPAIWNGYGLVVLPALAWIASGRAFHRAGRHWRIDGGFALRLSGAMLAAVALAVAFTNHAESVAGTLFLGIVLSALVVRAYRAEYVLGFAIGLASTIGGVLPVLVGGVIALISAVAWLVLRPAARRAVALLRR